MTNFNFNNPAPVSASDFKDLLSETAFAGLPLEEDKKEEDNDSGFPASKDLDSGLDLNLNSEGDSDISVKSENSEDSKEPKDSKEPEGLEIDPLKQEEVKALDYEKVIDTLNEKGIIVEPYEGFENDEVNEDALAKLLEHNIEKVVEERFEGFIEPLTDYTKRLIEFDINSKGKGVEEYLATLIEEQNIKNLSVENEYDQEKIIRQWYSRKEMKFTQAELEEKIKDLKEIGHLEKEARTIKPKLDEEAANIAKQKEEEQRTLRETENKVKEVYNKRLIDTLQTGKIGGINLTKEDMGSIYSILTGDESIEMNLPNGKKAMMNPLDAHIFYNKYAKEGSLERLVLAALLLTNPAKFEKEYSKKIETKVTNTFVKEHKYNNMLKGGKAEEKEQKETFTQKNKEAKWPNVLRK